MPLWPATAATARLAAAPLATAAAVPLASALPTALLVSSLLFLPLAVWVYIDARRSSRPTLAAPAYALLTLLIGPLAFAAYFAARTAPNPTAPLAARYAAVGAVGLGLLGAVVGLVIGLFAYAPTAPFAALELGLPSAVLGGLVGLFVGGCQALGRRITRRHA